MKTLFIYLGWAGTWDSCKAEDSAAVSNWRSGSLSWASFRLTSARSQTLSLSQWQILPHQPQREFFLRSFMSFLSPDPLEANKKPGWYPEFPKPVIPTPELPVPTEPAYVYKK